MKQTISLFASLAFVFAAGSAAYGQTVLYGTNFDGTTNATQFNDATAYTNSNVSGADLVGQGTWTGNDDPSTEEGGTATYHGGLNQVLPNTVGANLGGQLEGQVVANGNTVLPGQASVFVQHPFTLTAQAQTGIASLDTDFDITKSTNAVNSSYGFSFMNGTTNLLSIDFVQDPANVNARDIVQYQIGIATPVNNGNAIFLNTNYHLKIQLDLVHNTFTATYGGLNVFNGVSLGAVNAKTANELGVLEFGNTGADGNGGFTGSGQDTLTFDNFSLTIPEPSTYAMMVLGALGLAGVLRFRQRRA